jgi:hypothetical protein
MTWELGFEFFVVIVKPLPCNYSNLDACSSGSAKAFDGLVGFH